MLQRARMYTKLWWNSWRWNCTWPSRHSAIQKAKCCCDCARKSWTWKLKRKAKKFKNYSNCKTNAVHAEEISLRLVPPISTKFKLWANRNLKRVALKRRLEMGTSKIDDLHSHDRVCYSNESPESPESPLAFKDSNIKSQTFYPNELNATKKGLNRKRKIRLFPALKKTSALKYKRDHKELKHVLVCAECVLQPTSTVEANSIFEDDEFTRGYLQGWTTRTVKR